MPFLKGDQLSELGFPSFTCWLLDDDGAAVGRSRVLLLLRNVRNASGGGGGSGTLPRGRPDEC
jgi:hypothetical protein